MEDKELSQKITNSLFTICAITGTMFWFAIIVMVLFHLIEFISR